MCHQVFCSQKKGSFHGHGMSFKPPFRWIDPQFSLPPALSGCWRDAQRPNPVLLRGLHIREQLGSYAQKRVAVCTPPSVQCAFISDSNLVFLRKTFTLHWVRKYFVFSFFNIMSSMVSNSPYILMAYDLFCQ